jgi:hypothetical protein
MFRFKEVYLCVTGLVVNKYHKVSKACNRLYKEWATKIKVDKLKELLSSSRRSFVVLLKALFKVGNTEVMILIFNDLDIV